MDRVRQALSARPMTRMELEEHTGLSFLVVGDALWRLHVEE